MIRVYTTNDSNSEALRKAAGAKNYPLEILAGIDRSALSAALAETSALVFDLTCAESSAERVLAALDILDPERVPPILYLLSDPGQVDLITQSVSMLNQDYSFVPVDAAMLSSRLEVLLLLGARRKLTMESAITDRLTGLYNRKYFLRRLEEEMYRSKRYDYQIGVQLAEIDFAVPGHSLSESAGTEVMQQVGHFFKGRLRKSDQVARFKWDSFAVLLPDIGIEDSTMVAKDIKNKVERMQISADGHEVQTRVTISHMMLPDEKLTSTASAVAALEDGLLLAKTLPEGIAVFGQEG